jgi:hypothetical protein
MLCALAQYSYLTPDQLTRLCYSPGSLTYVRDLMAQLEHKGLVLRLHYRTQVFGNPHSLFTLSHAGSVSVSQQGSATRARVRPSEERELSHLFITHTILVNDAIIQAQLLSRVAPQVALHRFLHDRDLKRMPLTVRLPEGNDGQTVTRAVVGDAWLDFVVQRARGTFQSCLWLELHRGTVYQSRLRQKIRRLILAVKAGAYVATFGTASLGVGFIATPGEHEAEKVLRLVEDELIRLSFAHQAHLFLVTAGEPATMTPDALYLAPRWTVPLTRSRVSALDLN